MSVKVAVMFPNPLVLVSVSVLVVDPEKAAEFTTPSVPEPPLTLSSAGTYSLPLNFNICPDEGGVAETGIPRILSTCVK